MIGIDRLLEAYDADSRFVAYVDEDEGDRVIAKAMYGVNQTLFQVASIIQRGDVMFDTLVPIVIPTAKVRRMKERLSEINSGMIMGSFQLVDDNHMIHRMTLCTRGPDTVSAETLAHFIKIGPHVTLNYMPELLEVVSDMPEPEQFVITS